MEKPNHVFEVFLRGFHFLLAEDFIQAYLSLLSLFLQYHK